MKKLLLLSFLSASCLHVNSQVVQAGDMYPEYYDINPDELIYYTVTPYTNQTYALNLFGDPANDIEFTAHGAVSSGGSDAYISVTSLNPDVYIRFGRLDSVYAPGTSAWVVTKVAKPLATAEQVNAPTAMWDNAPLYLTDHSGHDGANKNVNDWIGGDKYLGLKYENGSNISYGWLRLRCVSEDSCYLKDYSIAGTVGIQEKEKTEAMIYPNPVNDHFYLKNTNLNPLDATKLKLKDLNGKEIEFSSETKGNSIRINIDPALPAGCYVLGYYSDTMQFTKKLIKVNK